MTYVKNDVKEVGVQVNDLCLGVDGKLWFTSWQKSILSLDLSSNDLQTHFGDDSFCVYKFDGERGAIGTLNGEILTFQVESPTLYKLPIPGRLSAIGKIAIDQESNSIFFGAAQTLYRVSFEGHLLGKWQFRMPSYCIGYASATMQLWSAFDGTEVIDIATGESRVSGRGRLCPYVNISIHSDCVACFGGDIDIFDGFGNQVESIDGDYNRGIFSPTGRLLVNEVLHDAPPVVSVLPRQSATGRKFDVVQCCDSHAFDSTGNSIFASRSGEIHCFLKS